MKRQISTHQHNPEPRLSRRQVAEIVGVCTETIKRAERRGDLPAEKINSRLTRYRVSDVEKWLGQAGSSPAE